MQGKSQRDVMVKVQDCSFDLSNLEFQPTDHVHFRINTLYKLLILLSPSHGLNDILAVLQNMGLT